MQSAGQREAVAGTDVISDVNKIYEYGFTERLVYAKPPFAGPAAVLAYLSRYSAWC